MFIPYLKAAILEGYPSEMTLVTFYSFFGAIQCTIASLIAEEIHRHGKLSMISSSSLSYMQLGYKISLDHFFNCIFDPPSKKSVTQALFFFSITSFKGSVCECGVIWCSSMVHSKKGTCVCCHVQACGDIYCCLFRYDLPW